MFIVSDENSTLSASVDGATRAVQVAGADLELLEVQPALHDLTTRGSGIRLPHGAHATRAVRAPAR